MSHATSCCGISATEMAKRLREPFLWVCAKRSKELFDGGRPVGSRPTRRACSGCSRSGAPGKVWMHRDAEAGRLWHHVYGALSAGRPEMLGAMTARAEAQVMRLACLTPSEIGSLVVAFCHILRAVSRCGGIASTRPAHLFAWQLGDPTADEIPRALLAVWPASLTRREILHDVFQRKTAAGEITSTLALLADCRLARSEQDRSGGGRPAERWFACQGHDHDDHDDRRWRGGAGKVVKVVKVVDATERRSRTPMATSCRDLVRASRGGPAIRRP